MSVDQGDAQGKNGRDDDVSSGLALRSPSAPEEGMVEELPHASSADDDPSSVAEASGVARKGSAGVQGTAAEEQSDTVVDETNPAVSSLIESDAEEKIPESDASGSFEPRSEVFGKAPATGDAAAGAEDKGVPGTDAGLLDTYQIAVDSSKEEKFDAVHDAPEGSSDVLYDSVPVEEGANFSGSEGAAVPGSSEGDGPEVVALENSTPQPLAMQTEANHLIESEGILKNGEARVQAEEADMPLPNPVEITFFVAPEGLTHKHGFASSATVQELIDTVEKNLGISSSNNDLLYNGIQMERNRTLESYGVAGGDALDVELRVASIAEAQASELTPNALEIRMDYGGAMEPRIIRVTIERESEAKQYLGGYQHKKTRVRYLHAETQTESTDELNADGDSGEAHVAMFHRDTQTVELANAGTITMRECATQMPRPGVHVSSKYDDIRTAREYFDAEKLAALREKKAIEIQRIARGFLARRVFHKVRVATQERADRLAEAEAKYKEREEARRRREIERRMHPKTPADFQILYQELEAWRIQETKKIDASYAGDERKRRLHRLLLKEVKLLQTIDRLKLLAHSENKEKVTNKKLDIMASPKKWRGEDGEVTAVVTPFTTRAAELRSLHQGLRASGLSVDERLDVLLHVKWTVKEFDCNLTREIVELIDREADMLNRGRSAKSLAGLRQRLANLFLMFVETPEFNPEAMRFQKVPAYLLSESDTKTLSSGTI